MLPVLIESLMNPNYFFYLAVALGVIYIFNRLRIRLQLSRAKHPSLRGHSKWSRRISKLLPFFDYTQSLFFCSDGAPHEVTEQRKQAFERLKQKTQHQNSKSLAQSAALENSISDVKFTSNYRVPFPYRTDLPSEFRLGTMVDETKGSKIRDIDGNWRFDLSGSYGVNVFGYDFYKQCMQEGFNLTNELGPALGPYHPLITENVEFIKQVSGLDEVSFHMSGTEAVMQAVRLARYHTKKTHLVRFCGAYHGWWDGVQPGIGNRRKTNDVYTLADLSEATIKVLETRNDIACLLINPLQAFHPNADSFSDNTLIASDRKTAFDKKAYAKWLARLQAICNRRNIILIFDEVFVGFRLGMRGAQEYFNIQADLVTYGKTLGGGMPIGVLAGRNDLMKRYRDNQPADVSFARGTFNSHPAIMGSMNAFIRRIQTPEIQAIYQSAEQTWNKRVALFNERMFDKGLPIKLSNMHSILTLHYLQPSRYNWMLQFYLRSVGIELSWLGTGRFIMSFSFTDEEFAEVIECFVVAASQMQDDGWWWNSPHLTNKAIKRQFIYDMLVTKFPILNKCLKSPLISQEMRKKSRHLSSVNDTNMSNTNVNSNTIKKVG